MRVLVVHNRYHSASPSGENSVVDAEVDLLSSPELEVGTFFRASDEIATLSIGARTRAALAMTRVLPPHRQFDATLESFAPDIVHLHNPYPMIAPTIIDRAVAAGVPVVASIHNYRLECIAGSCFRNGAVCTDCFDRGSSVPGIIHRCYRESRAQSAVMAIALRRNEPSWHKVRRFIAVSDFIAQRLEALGIAPDRITVRRHVTRDPGAAVSSGEGLLFAGRLVEEKGLRLLLDAWTASGLDGHQRLVIAGAGPLDAYVRQRASSMRSVEVTGLLSTDAVVAARTSTAACVIPSVCWEAQSSAPESFAVGRPVIATRSGGLADIVDSAVGWSVDLTVNGLAAAMREATDGAEAQVRGVAARQRFEAEFSPDAVRTAALAIYRSVLG